MVIVATEDQLRNLRSGDRLKYHGVEWQVADYSTYTDPNGYETEEWLLNSASRKEYYLLRELDPENPALVNWYIAEELRQPTLIEPESQRDVLTSIWDDMQDHQTPYANLRALNRLYAFESETEGVYESDDGSSNRITWDYWDQAHLWNLALEAWEDGTLVVYSTRKVQPSDFTNLQTGGGSRFIQGFQSSSSFGRNRRSNEARSMHLVVAWFVTILGFILMMAGL